MTFRHVETVLESSSASSTTAQTRYEPAALPGTLMLDATRAFLRTARALATTAPLAERNSTERRTDAHPSTSSKRHDTSSTPPAITDASASTPAGSGNSTTARTDTLTASDDDASSNASTSHVYRRPYTSPATRIDADSLVATTLELRPAAHVARCAASSVPRRNDNRTTPRPTTSARNCETRSNVPPGYASRAGITADGGAADTPIPSSFTATTANVYARPFTSPVTVHFNGPDTHVHDRPPGDAETTYDEITPPPFDAGAPHDTTAR